MLDIKMLRTEPEKVKENIRKKFQDEKLPLVDEVVELDQKFREAKSRGDYLRSQRNRHVYSRRGDDGTEPPHAGSRCGNRPGRCSRRPSL